MAQDLEGDHGHDILHSEVNGHNQYSTSRLNNLWLEQITEQSQE